MSLEENLIRVAISCKLHILPSVRRQSTLQPRTPVGLVSPAPLPTIPVNVSEESRGRALRILDARVRTLEA